MSPEGSGSSRYGFYKILTEAVADITAHGFDSASRLMEWQERLTRAADMTLGNPHARAKMLRDAMEEIFRRLVEKGGVLAHHEGIEPFKLQRLKPKLRAEVDRRILASAELIRLNRDTVIRDMVQRFTGWASSIPAGGAERSTNKTDAKDDIRKSLASMPFLERRVIIDQSHKLIAAIDDIIAKDEGAIAGRWHSQWRKPGYDYRHDHKERDGKIYLIRDSWAHKTRFVKPGDVGYTDQITEPGQEIFCNCRYVYLYALRQLPADMITRKGEVEMHRLRAA